MGIQVNLPRANSEALDLDGAAAGALDVVTGSEGYPASWGMTASAADSVQRFGLLEGPRTVRISETKLSRLQGASLTSSANGKLDYADARAALGLAGYGFHLRTMPVFDPYGDGYYGVEGLDSTRVGYVGDYSSNGVTESAASANEAAMLDAFPVAYTNTKFAASQAAPGGDKFPDHKPTIETYLIPRLAGWLRTEHAVTQDSPGTYTWRLYDSSHLSSIPAGWTGGHAVGMGTATTPNYGPAEDDRLVSPTVDVRGERYPQLTIREYIDGECTFVLGSCVTPLDYSVVEVSPTSAPLSWTTVTTAGDTWTTGGAWRTRTFNLTTCIPCQAGPVHVGLRWVSNPTNTGQGWVVDDVKVWDALDNSVVWSNGNELDTSYYRILIVGSNVDQTGLNEDTIKFRLRDWVLAGGNLYVFGSTARSDNWMQPIFGAGLGAGASQPPYSPDPTHPLLQTPNELAHTTYPTDGNVWRIANAYQSKFAQVVGITPPANPPDRDDILSVSLPGAYNNGTVILTTYLPYQMSGDEDTKLLANFFMYGRYSLLYLDYGKAVPPHTSVGTATRLILAPKTIDPVGPKLEMLVTVQVWRDASP